MNFNFCNIENVQKYYQVLIQYLKNVPNTNDFTFTASNYPNKKINGLDHYYLLRFLTQLGFIERLEGVKLKGNRIRYRLLKPLDPNYSLSTDINNMLISKTYDDKYRDNPIFKTDNYLNLSEKSQFLFEKILIYIQKKHEKQCLHSNGISYCYEYFIKCHNPGFTFQEYRDCIVEIVKSGFLYYGTRDYWYIPTEYTNNFLT